MNMFQEIKDAVSVKEAASFYGLKVRRNGMCCCPFHNDKTPSMKVDRRYHCFGCGEDGDVINFVQKLFGLDAKEAAFKLIDDFQLNIDTNRKESRSEKNARIRRMKAKQHEKDICLAYAEELRRFRLKLAELHRTIDNLKKANTDVNYSNSKLAYSIKVDENKKDCNSNYDSQEEIGQRICEEARILYVALTRAIRNCIWMKDADKKSNMSWSRFLEV